MTTHELTDERNGPMSDTEKRAEYVKGLHMFADLLENNPDIPLPYSAGVRSDNPLTTWFHASRGDVKAGLTAAARVFPGKLDKTVEEAGYFNLKGQLAGLYVEFTAMRSDVCQRVVVAERTVIEQVPDPDVKVPLVEVTKTVQDVKWICPPSFLAEGVR